MEKLSNITKKVFQCMLYTILYTFLYNHFMVPKIIGERLTDLGIMEYNSTKDIMVPKDSLDIGNYDIYYIQYGDLKGY